MSNYFITVSWQDYSDSSKRNRTNLTHEFEHLSELDVHQIRESMRESNRHESWADWGSEWVIEFMMKLED